MDLSRLARRSALSGRTWCRETEAGSRISRAFLNGGLHQGISSGVAFVSPVDPEVPSLARSTLAASDGEGLSQTANWSLRISMRETDKCDHVMVEKIFCSCRPRGECRLALSALINAASMSAAGTRVIAPGGGVAIPRRYGWDT